MNTSHTLCASVLACLMVGCGGSPSEPTPTPTPTPTLALSSLQGIWRSPTGAASTWSAIVLPDGKAWALISNADSSRVIKASFAVQGSAYLASGNSFTLGSTSRSSSSLSASVVAQTSLTGIISSATQTENFSLAYQVRYASPAVLRDFAGDWHATLGPGRVNWSISDAGLISGTRSTGCSYAGLLSLRAEQKAVVDVAVTEDCAGVLTQLKGVAVLSEDKLNVNMLLTNSDDSAAVALNLAR
ncbi:MAG: hypothetical protein ACOYNF_13095 [Rhodoferax sp.]